ncbi:CDC48-associated ubiquitin-like/zinc finger protein 1 [Monosporozyma unispora]|nr:hypothetical protein C6P44_000027 [Kazachstania unispora]
MIKETGMLDVGTHCFYCKQIDFLPFHCNECNHDFCSKHRLKEDHHCIALLNNQDEENETTPMHNGHGKFFQSLLPARASERIKSPSPTYTSTTIKSSLNKSSLDKLLKFFHKHKSKHLIKKSLTSSILSIQKNAIGDSKIPKQNRIYIYCYAIDSNFESIDPTPVYINKIWPLGRCLDYLASQLDIKNMNLQADPNTKLFLYKAINNNKSSGQELIELNPNDRVNGKIMTLDTLYLIRGELKKD